MQHIYSHLHCSQSYTAAVINFRVFLIITTDTASLFDKMLVVIINYNIGHVMWICDPLLSWILWNLKHCSHQWSKAEPLSVGSSTWFVDSFKSSILNLKLCSSIANHTQQVLSLFSVHNPTLLQICQHWHKQDLKLL